MINYNKQVFGIDKNKVYLLFKEFEVSLDYSSVSFLSYFLLFLLDIGGCDYKKSLDLSFELGEIARTSDTKEYMSNLKDYVFRKNNIKFKRVIYRIENKRQLFDDIVRAL